MATTEIIATQLPILLRDNSKINSNCLSIAQDKPPLTLGRTLAAAASGIAGAAVGLKAGLAIGSLFGPFGMALGPIVGAFYYQQRFLQRTLDCPIPSSQTAADMARVVSAAANEHASFAREATS